MDNALLNEFAAGLLDHLVGHSHIGIALMNWEGAIVRANPALAGLAGRASGNMEDMQAIDAVAPSYRETFLRAVTDARDGHTVEAHVSILSTNGLCHPCTMRVWPGESGCLALFHEDQESLRGADPLTGAQTADAFYEALTLEIYRSRRYHQPLALLKCQVDKLEEIVERYGDSVAERVLAMVGTRLLRQTRRTDLVARVSPAELAVLLPETSLAGALTACEKLSDAVKEIAIETRDGTVCPTASFGAVAFSDPTASDPRVLIDAADWALSIAKKRGPCGIEAAPSVA